MSIILGILTVILIFVAVILIFLVLMQPAKSDGGMGAAMGGGMAESAFGGETSNVLSRATIKAAIAFFVLSFLLFLGNVYQRQRATATGGALPNIPVPASASTSPTSTAPNNVQAEILKQLQQQMAKQPAPAPVAGPAATTAPAPAAPTPAAPPKTP
ncbi:MAG TPA: preprotein translocase subunit SecG [Opitutaceae bacterium]|nr:preprotein translocase subunit SecG [Opitutaceae bacterium]